MSQHGSQTQRTVFMRGSALCVGIIDLQRDQIGVTCLSADPFGVLGV